MVIFLSCLPMTLQSSQGIWTLNKTQSWGRNFVTKQNGLAKDFSALYWRFIFNTIRLPVGKSGNTVIDCPTWHASKLRQVRSTETKTLDTAMAACRGLWLSVPILPGNFNVAYIFDLIVTVFPCILWTPANHSPPQDEIVKAYIRHDWLAS